MNVNTITMPADEARAKLREYRRRLHDGAHKDAVDKWTLCEQLYAELSDGQQLIDIEEAIRNGGFDALRRPKLAIARADREQVRFRWWSHEDHGTFDTHHANAARRSEELTIRVNFGRQPNLLSDNGRHYTSIDAYALVPMVPADVRPSTGQLREWFVLWEVDNWSTRPFTAQPPRDPFLLAHVNGPFYCILAEWDLTEVERAVMRLTAAQRRDGR